MFTANTSPLLKINRVVVTGQLGCDINLGSGINVIKAESFDGEDNASNDCGKTTFTELIKYGLGYRERFNSGNLADNIDCLFLEININNKVFTIKRDLNKPSSRLAIYKRKYNSDITNDVCNQINPQTDYSDFLLNELEIPNIRVPQSSKPGATIIPITFQNYLRLFYMDQKDSFQEILNKVQPEWLKPKLVEIVLGMSKEELEKIDLKISSLINVINDSENKIRHIKEFLIKSGNTNQVDVSQRMETLKRKELAISDKINELKKEMRGNHGITDDLREQLNETNNQLTNLTDRKEKLNYKISDFQRLLNSLIVDRDLISKTKEADKIISTIEFTQCPRCLQIITSEMRGRDVHGICTLCNRPLLAKNAESKILSKDEIVDDEIKEAKILLEKYSNEITQIENEINKLNLEKTRFQESLDGKSKTYVSPFVDELERLLQNLNRLNAEISLLNQQMDQWQVLEKEETFLNKSLIEKEQLNEKRKEISIRDVSKIRRLSDYYDSFLRSVGLTNLVRAEISSSDLMPLVNGHPYTEDTGHGMVSVKVIGYHYALLAYSLDNPSYYPRFLILDSPRQFDLNQATYDKLMFQFEKLMDKLDRSDFQVIITTRRLPSEMEPHVVERLNNKTRMLLRLESDREQSSYPLLQK